MSTAVATAPANKSMFGALQKPDVGPTGGLEKVENTAAGAPYVGFHSRKSSRVAEVSAALPGLADGAAYFKSPEGYKKLDDGNRIMVLAADQKWVQVDNKNVVLDAIGTNPGDFKSPFKESIEALVLVFVGGTVEPATMRFRTKQCPAAHSAIQEVKNAGTAEWGLRTADHKAAMNMPFPEYRVVAPIQSTIGTTKNGHTVVEAKTQPRPVSAGEITLLLSVSSNPDFQRKLAAATERYKFSVKMVADKVAAHK